ncbi:MAG TPA: thioredoxin [Spirochaetota bacterium]|nr:thioredoxin [Spirochaetota bacterium]
MLETNLQHIESSDALARSCQQKKNLMICCGQMGAMCTPVFKVMEKLAPVYPHVSFQDIDMYGPAGDGIARLPECRNFTALPFIVYFKNGKVAAATSGLQNQEQITALLNKHFSKP